MDNKVRECGCGIFKGQFKEDEKEPFCSNCGVKKTFREPLVEGVCVTTEFYIGHGESSYPGVSLKELKKLLDKV